MQLHKLYVVWKLSIREAQICSLGRIGRKTKEVRLSRLLERKLRIFSLELEACAPCIDRTRFFLRRSYITCIALESSRLAELKYAISAAWGVREKLTAFGRLDLNEIFPSSKSVLLCKARLPQLEVQDNLQKGEPKACSKGGLFFRETGQRLRGS